MEIVLAVLLIFGSFALGSITADEGGDESQPTTALSNTGGVLDSPQATQAARQINPASCLSNASSVYRDLTVPYNGHVGQQASQVSDCEGECPDE